jgi:hypothetical protein
MNYVVQKVSETPFQLFNLTMAHTEVDVLVTCYGSTTFFLSHLNMGMCNNRIAEFTWLT